MKPLRKQGIIIFSILALILVACGGATEETSEVEEAEGLYLQSRLRPLPPRYLVCVFPPDFPSIPLMLILIGYFVVLFSTFGDELVYFRKLLASLRNLLRADACSTIGLG